jgi:hypothetical protein
MLLYHEHELSKGAPEFEQAKRLVDARRQRSIRAVDTSVIEDFSQVTIAPHFKTSKENPAVVLIPYSQIRVESPKRSQHILKSPLRQNRVHDVASGKLIAALGNMHGMSASSAMLKVNLFLTTWALFEHLDLHD